jgi:hypothetical protein
MDKSFEVYLKKVLKGIWSPFLRRRIKRELLDHLKDISQDRYLPLNEAIDFLGHPEEANILYKNLLYRKLKHDMVLFGGSLVSLFIVGIIYIHHEVGAYQRQALSDYSMIENKYKADVESLVFFKRTNEIKNADSFLSKVVGSEGRIIDDNFMSKIDEFDYWEPSGQIDRKLMIQLAKFAYKNATKKDYQKLAQLIYSTETMEGYRVANSMMEGTLLNEQGRVNFYRDSRASRVSGTTWGLLNLRPSIIGFERSFKNSNYFNVGICHHAEEFWFQDSFFKNVTKTGLPGERDWEKELSSVNSIKAKMKRDCRLSFLKHTQEPAPMTWDSIYVTGPEDEVFRRMYEQLIVSVSTVPYLRNIAGRYIVDRASIGIQGDGKEVYRN